MSHFIINLLLFFFQFEFLSNGGLFTIARVVIFPLLCLYLFLQKRVCFPITPAMFLCLSFFIVQIFSCIGNREYSLLFSTILQFLILLVFTDYFHKKKELSLQNWLMLSTYDIASFICYLKGYSVYGISRFSAFYWDPNVMSFYILISLASKIYLSFLLKNKKIKILLIVIMLIDVFLIIQSISRGALLTLLIIFMLVLYKYSRFLILSFIALSIPIISYLYIRYHDVYWDSSMSSFEILMVRLFSNTSNELTSAQDGTRLVRYQYFFESLFRGDVSILGNSTSVMSDGEYIHNGLLEIILTVGAPMGVLFICMFFYLIYCTIVKQILYMKYNFSIFLPISFLISSFFYSYLGYKMFWFFMAILVFNQYNIKYKVS